MQDYLQEVGALTMRWVKRLSREKFSMVFTLFQPMVFWLIFFGNLFQRTANAEVVQAPSYIAFLAACVVGLTAISMALAFSVKSHGDFFSMLGFLSLPMIFLSTALVPLAAMPKWMAVLAQLNPMTWAIDAVRPLILSGWAAALPKIGIVVIVMTVFDSICLFGAARAFRRTLG